MNDSFVVIINTIRRPKDLVERSLAAALKQPSEHLKKVILIDQNTPPLQLGSEFVNHLKLQIQKSPHPGVAAARSSVADIDSYDWIVFCDDDGYLAPEYFKNLIATLSQNPKPDIVAGSIKRTDTGGFYSLRHQIGGNLQKFVNTKLLMGSNFVVRRKVFDGLGRFTPEFGAGALWGSGEETDFCWKAFFAGKRMEFCPELVVFHQPPFNESLTGGWKKSFSYGVGKGALVSHWIFKQRRGLILLEAAEMVAIPIVQMLKGLVTLKPGLIVNNLATLLGRLWGIVKYCSAQINNQ